MTVNFYQTSFFDSWEIINAKLPGNCYRVLELLKSSAVFGDGFVHIPPVKEIAAKLKIGVSTVYQHLKTISEKIKSIQIIPIRSVTLVGRIDTRKSVEPKNFLLSENLENFPINRNYFQKFINNSEKSENQQPEDIPEANPDSPQTLQTLLTFQTGKEVDEKINKEIVTEEKVVEEVNKKEEEEKENKYTVLSNHQQKAKIPPNVTQKKYDIPVELIERLKMAEIKTSEQVLVKISQHHISQAYGAVTHVENTFETIKDKTAVFLYQLPKQPIEKLGQRHSEEILSKQKEELKRIEEEIKQGRKSLSDISGFSSLKQRLAEMAKKHHKKN